MKAPGIHHAARRRGGGVAAGGPGAAAGDAGDRVSHSGSLARLRSSVGFRQGLEAKLATSKARM